MKHIILILGCLLSTLLPQQTFALNIIPYGTPILDATLATGEWAAESRVRVSRFYGSDQFADFYLQWDENNLYIAGYIEDTTLQEDAAGSRALFTTSDDDSVEIYLHPSNAAPSVIDQNSRVIAFTPTGNFQRLDRGTGVFSTPTAGLESFKNTTEKISQFLNVALPKDWVCPNEQPVLEVPTLPVITQFKPASDASAWWFEMALPWALVGTRSGLKIVANNCGLGTGLFPTIFAAGDGSILRMNFKRINDNNGGNNNTIGEGSFINPVTQKEGSNGTLNDEWTVYQGDYRNPQEWDSFILRKKTLGSPSPSFANPTLTTALLEGRRAYLKFTSPRHGLHADQPAAAYKIRYQTGTIAVDATSWQNMTVFPNAYVPKAPNSAETIQLLGLSAGETYTVALRAEDEIGRESDAILSANFTTPNATPLDSEAFVTTAATGRNFVTTDNKPFLLMGETGLMPWLPLRGLYTADLCDEHPPIGDEFFNAQTAEKTCGSDGTGRLRNYSTEAIFFDCHLSDGTIVGISDVGLDGPEDNCNGVADAQSLTVSSIEAKEGRGLAERYMAKLKDSGVNVLSVFVESLDLEATPIFFEDPITGAFNENVFDFLDNLVQLARDNNVYLLIRLYDTYYYRSKWKQTHWHTLHGVATSTNFFDANLYDIHKTRLNAIFNHVNSLTGVKYSDEPHIMGWDLLNEVDNKERFNVASYAARKAWLDTMLAHAHAVAPRQLSFFSFLTWDPKDDAFYRDTNTEDLYLGIDSRMAYRLDGADVSALHGYYAHIANPSATPATAEHARPLELARGVSYGFYQNRTGRPLLDTEGAPSPLFIEKYDANFTLEDDTEMFLNSAWLHFVAGGAGANMRWPIDLQVSNLINQVPTEWRAFLTVMQNTVGNLSWRGDSLEVNHQRLNNSTHLYFRHDKQQVVAYLFNPDKQAITHFPMRSLPAVSANIKLINPRTGAVILEQAVANIRNVTLPAQSDHVVLMATGRFNPEQDNVFDSATGILHLTAVNVVGLGILDVNLNLIAGSNPLSFALKSASHTRSERNAQTALYTGTTVSIPSVSVGDARYQVDLKVSLDATGGLSFQLGAVNLIVN